MEDSISFKILVYARNKNGYVPLLGSNNETTIS